MRMAPPARPGPAPALARAGRGPEHGPREGVQHPHHLLGGNRLDNSPISIADGAARDMQLVAAESR
ncbi:MAG: hypothetical protein MZV70_39755 [Desulfobacterales bacterium]|nr:hypothetical protein [Desulfobacterales bacterium]